MLEKDFPDLEMNTANEIEVEVHKYMREISRKFLEKKLQKKINEDEKELIKTDKNLETINIQKKLNTIYGEIEVKRRYFNKEGIKIEKILSQKENEES